jgi:hypothetical protein
MKIAISIHRFRNSEFNGFGHEAWPFPPGVVYSLILGARASYWDIIKSTFLAKNYTALKLTVYLTQIDQLIFYRSESRKIKA